MMSVFVGFFPLFSFLVVLLLYVHILLFSFLFAFSLPFSFVSSFLVILLFPSSLFSSLYAGLLPNTTEWKQVQNMEAGYRRTIYPLHAEETTWRWACYLDLIQLWT
jgi:hypothetical protein